MQEKLAEVLPAASNTETFKKIIEEDLFTFCREVLGYRLLRDQPHIEVCEFIQIWKKRKKMFLMARNTFKSTIGTIGFTIQELCKNPNIRILISSETIGQAQRLLREIKGHLEGNNILHAFYGNPVVDVGWKENEITVAQRTVNKKEPTVGTAGTEAAHVGAHWDLIICDDVQSDLNTANPEQMMKVRDWYRLLLSQLEPDGRILTIGTRWNDSDLYGHILDTVAGEYDIKIEPAIRSDGSLFFPDRLSKTFLEEQQREQGSFLFSSQYLLQCVAADEQTFRPSWFRYFSKAPDDLAVFIACDPSLTQKDTDRGDATAIVVVGVAPNNDWYVLDLVNRRLSPHEINAELIRLAQTYRPIKIGIEAVSFGKLISSSFQQACRSAGLSVPVQEITHGKTSKELRIKGLQPYFERGQVYFAKQPDAVSCDGWYALHEQLTRFPRAKHDDVPDAMSFIMQMAWMRSAARMETSEQASNRIFNERMRAKRKVHGDRYALTMA